MDGRLDSAYHTFDLTDSPNKAAIMGNSLMMGLPPVEDKDYHESFADLLDFYHDFAASASEFHPVVMLSDHVDNYWAMMGKGVTPNMHISMSGNPCIWFRDWFPVHSLAGLIKFRYQPKYLKKPVANAIDSWLWDFLPNTMNIAPKRSQVILDGGNIVMSPDKTMAILTTRICADNPSMEPSQIIAYLQDNLGLDRVILIPPEFGDITGHSDGMVRFATNDTIVINRFKGKARDKILEALVSGLPSNMKVLEVPYNYSLEKYKGFPSAAGNYINFVLTNQVCIVPTFGNAREDSEAVSIISSAVSVPTRTVNTSTLARFGGLLNCITWEGFQI